MPGPDIVLRSADLRRAVPARQLLTARASIDVPGAIELVAGLPSQYATTSS